MRIGISTCMIQRGRSGVARQVLALAQALVPFAREHRIHLFVLDDDLPLFAFLGGQLELVSVPERFRSPLPSILWHQTGLVRQARRLELEVLHVPSYRRLPFPRPCALVATIHDLAPFHLTGKYDPLRTFYAKVVVKHLARRQDRIIAVSHTTARDLARFFQITDTVAVVHNGIDHTRFSPVALDGEAALDRYRLTRPFFLYVARLEHPAKNHLRLLEAFALFKRRTGLDWQLALAGSDWHGAKIIHQAVQRSPVAADIRPLGFVPEEHLPGLYRAAQAFVYPSLYEGFGLPPVEAMACGCPVLSSTAGALAEVVADAALVLDPSDATGMAEKLAQLAGDAELRARLRRAGLAQARRFDWNQTAAQTVQVYAQALQGGSPSLLHSSFRSR